jgi:hypothetical protein
VKGVTNAFICSEKQGDFISFSDPLGDSFDSRREDRTQGRYWKGFDQDDKNINTRYKVIEDDLSEFKRSRKWEGEYGGSSRRRSPSPRQVRCQLSLLTVTC